MRQGLPKVFSFALILALMVSFLPAQNQKVQAATPTDLFFSEYVEGSSSNKAVEIFNGTGAAIDLAVGGYSLRIYSNGNTIPSLIFNLTGTVIAGDVFVVMPNLASATLQTYADLIYTGATGWFNGNDAVVLMKDTTIIDVIGQIGFDPGTAWGIGTITTLNHTLRRSSTVCAGDPDGSDAFDPSVQWEGYAQDTFDGLGSHTATCGGPDVAPTVTSTYPANGAADVSTRADLTVNFSEAVNLTAPWFSLTCSTSGEHTAAVSGGPTSFTLNPDTDFADGDVCTFTVTALKVSDQDADDPPDNMASDYTLGFTAIDVCSLEYTDIYEIQGSGAATPLSGTQTTMGIVVGDFEVPSVSGQIQGFYIQDATGDANAATSDGLFVYNPGRNNVSLGNLVRVTGTVSEYNEQTQISAPAGGTTVCGTGTATPTDIAFPLASADALEKFEGMLVRVPQTMYVTEHYQLGRFGQVTLSSDGRLSQPTNVVLPGAPALALQAENNLRKIILDDADNVQNADPIVFARGGLPLSASNTLRGGDTATGIVGVLGYTWGGNAASPNAWRIRPVNAMSGTYYFAEVNSRPTIAPSVFGTVRVVGMNLLNYYNTFSGCTNGVGGSAADCRGASNATEFERQWTKTVVAIIKMDADVIGFTELENDGYGTESALAHLVGKLNDASAPGTYALIDADSLTGQTNALGIDGIKVGMIYQPASVSPIGDTAVLNTPAFVTGGDSVNRNRPTLAQAFKVNATGALFIVDVNHLKSKGSACNAPDAGDGQGNCNVVRTNAATELVNWLATDPTGTGDPDILLLGDYNAYAMEDPITVIKNGGYTNLIAYLIGSGAYSYVFDGQWGYLDHALGSASIVSQVTGGGDYHINADEPSVLDYLEDNKSAGQLVSLYAADEFRISDHDPVIVGLDLNPAPNVDAGGPYAVDEGSSVTLTAIGSGADVNSLTYDWDLDNNGTYETPGKSVSYAGADGPAEITVKVQVTDSGGLKGTDSATVTVFNVAPTVEMPVVSPNPSVAGTGVSTKATFSDPAATLDEPYTCMVEFGDGSGGQVGVVSGTTCTGPAHTFAKSGAYIVTVSVTDADTTTGTKSVIHNVKAKPPMPLWPSISSTTVNPKFIWTKTVGETKYAIELRTKAGVLVKTLLITTPTCTATTCSYTPNPKLALVIGKDYKWKVRSFKTVWSNYSSYKAFKMLAPPAPQTPSGVISVTNPKFTWKKIPGATQYTIELKKASGVNVRTMVIKTLNCTATTCSYTPSPLLNLAAGGYKWRVKAFNGYYGPFSSYKAFTER